MILIVSYYNKGSKNGASHRLNSLFEYIKQNKHQVKFLTYGEADNDLDTIPIIYWKNLNLLKKIPIVLLRTFNLLGVTFRDSHFSNQVLKRVEELNPSTVLLSYPTIDSLFLAEIISRNNQIKVVFDYRDGITKYPLEKLNIFQKRAYRKIESILARRRNITRTAINEYLVDGDLKNNLVEIPNFRDLEPLVLPVTFKQSKSMKILHFGQIGKSYNRRVDYFYQAIVRLCRYYPNIRFNFHFYGRLTDVERQRLEDLNLPNLYISIFDPVEVSDLMGIYDLALLLGVEGHKGYVSSKFYSYLELKLPIIAAANQNLVGTYITDFNLGAVGGFDEKFLLDSFSKMNGQVYYDKKLEKFSQHVQHRKFYNVLR
jgi:hypothetical protein